ALVGRGCGGGRGRSGLGRDRCGGGRRRSGGRDGGRRGGRSGRGAVLRRRAAREAEGGEAQGEGGDEFLHGGCLFSGCGRQSASLPVSPVRMRTTCSNDDTKILP